MDGLEKFACDFGPRIVIDAALLKKVGDLEVKAALACSNLAVSLKEFVEVIFPITLVQFEPLVVEDKSLDDELPQGLGGPDTKRRCLEAIDAIAN